MSLKMKFIVLLVVNLFLVIIQCVFEGMLWQTVGSASMYACLLNLIRRMKLE